MHSIMWLMAPGGIKSSDWQEECQSGIRGKPAQPLVKGVWTRTLFLFITSVRMYVNICTGTQKAGLCAIFKCSLTFVGHGKLIVNAGLSKDKPYSNKTTQPLMSVLLGRYQQISSTPLFAFLGLTVLFCLILTELAPAESLGPK